MQQILEPKMVKNRTEWTSASAAGGGSVGVVATTTGTTESSLLAD